MTKIDLRKHLKELYGTTSRDGFVIVDVPKMNFLMVDGTGDPNTAKSYRDALEVLFALSYGLKFMVKKGAAAVDYAVMPLEGLWWTEDPAKFSVEDKSNWHWTAMIMQPEWVDADLVEAARAETAKKKQLPALAKVRFEAFEEGKAAQCLHIGPYSEEAPKIAALHDFIAQSGGRRRGKHHEIYLSDARRADPAKLKTIIRQPMG